MGRSSLVGTFFSEAEQSMASKMDVETSNSGKDDAQTDHTAASYYFDSYSHFGIHEEMLKDSMRTNTYYKAITQTLNLAKDQVVLDVGCGTGILSLFAAKAGAKHVYGIEMSSIADQAKEIVKDNGMEDKITIIRGKVEEVSLPVEKVDVIISEWMGYLLLYESMLDTVIHARNKWLRPGGLMLPDKASMYICGIEDGEYKNEKIDFWDNVYGFNFGCIKKLAMIEPLVDCVEDKQICTNVSRLITLDLNTVQKTDLVFEVPFSIQGTKNDYVHALVVWFNVEFTECHKPLTLSTSPLSRNTHWKQTVFYLDRVLTVCQGENITGRMAIIPNEKNPRDLDVSINYQMNGKHCKALSSQEYRMR